jgi:hypothetical protein
VISATVRSGGEFLVAGAVRGLASEVAPLMALLETFRPEVVGLGISLDELQGLRDHFVDRASEPLVPLTGAETAEVKGLSRFGEVRVPNPACIEVLEWGRSRGTPVEPLDPSDETYATMFTDHISYFELLRRTLKERRLARAPPTAATPEEYAATWHRSMSGGRGSRSFDAARDAALVENARRLSARAPRVAVVVDLERYDSVLRRLGAPTG